MFILLLSTQSDLFPTIAKRNISCAFCDCTEWPSLGFTIIQLMALKIKEPID